MKHVLMAIALCASMGSACAQVGSAGAPALIAVPRAGVLTIEGQASAEVPVDVATVTLVAEGEDKDPAALAQRINATLEQTLKEAKAEPRVTARSGGYRSFPATDRDGRITAWRARAEIVLESRDFAALSKLAGSMSGRMQVAGMTFSLSPESRQAHEDRLVAEAIARFQSRARAAAKAFGYADYGVLEVSVNTQSPPPVSRPYMAAMAKSAERTAVPVEGGRTTVTVGVSGSVQMQK